MVLITAHTGGRGTPGETGWGVESAKEDFRGQDEGGNESEGRSEGELTCSASSVLLGICS